MTEAKSGTDEVKIVVVGDGAVGNPKTPKPQNPKTPPNGLANYNSIMLNKVIG